MSDKIDKQGIKKIDEWVRKNSSYSNYYCEPSIMNKTRNMLNYNPRVNCSDIDLVEEECNKYEKEYFKKHILREATPEELEWIKKQPRVDLDSPEHEHLKPILRKMIEEGWFD